MSDFGIVLPGEAPPMRRTRKRMAAMGFLAEDEAGADAARQKREELAGRVVKLVRQDREDFSAAREAALQRYAKYRMWSEGKDWPWPNASDMPVPDLMANAQRLQDTLCNAAVLTRPMIGAKAKGAGDTEKEKKVDQLTDYQFFVEQRGEERIAEAADDFWNQTALIGFVRWARTTKAVRDLQLFDPVPDGMRPADRFFEILTGDLQFDAEAIAATDEEGWDYEIAPPQGVEAEPVYARFYTNDQDEIELCLTKTVTGFDGPLVVLVDRNQLHIPAGCANLQAPGPDNPGGAPHAVLEDYPTRDEIKALIANGYYDLPDAADLERILTTSAEPVENAHEMQKDALGGAQASLPQRQWKAHGRLTRHICFDRYDIDGDGLEEDVVIWVLEETKTLLKIAYLSEAFPMSPPGRPLHATSLYPVARRVDGISGNELLEGVHDAMKISFDQMIDAGTLANAPPGFYRQASGFKPESLTYTPGELIPIANPTTDVFFPRMGNPNAQAHALNLMSILNTMQERLTMQSDMQFGRVQPGASSAMRTIGGMAMLAQAGEARPERILRRFFGFWAVMFFFMHELNRRKLPKEKRVRIAGTDGQQAFLTLGPEAIDGDMEFEFSANVFNTSKANLQQALQAIMSVAIQPIMVQAGIVTPANIFKLMRDFVLSLGQRPADYVTAPTPEADKPKLTFEEALLSITNGDVPDCVAAEAGGEMEHLQKAMAYIQSPEIAAFVANTGDQGMMMLALYIQQVQQRAQREQQQVQLMQAAAASQGQGQGQPGRPAQGPPDSPEQPKVEGGELLDESLPGAGGGANAERSAA